MFTHTGHSAASVQAVGVTTVLVLSYQASTMCVLALSGQAGTIASVFGVPCVRVLSSQAGITASAFGAIV